MEINILYHNTETEKYKNTNQENYDWRELDVIPCYLQSFYAAHPIYNNGIEYTQIFIGENSLICILEYKEFLKEIQTNKQQ